MNIYIYRDALPDSLEKRKLDGPSKHPPFSKGIARRLYARERERRERERIYIEREREERERENVGPKPLVTFPSSTGAKPLDTAPVLIIENPLPSYFKLTS